MSDPVLMNLYKELSQNWRLAEHFIVFPQQMH